MKSSTSRFELHGYGNVIVRYWPEGNVLGHYWRVYASGYPTTWCPTEYAAWELAMQRKREQVRQFGWGRGIQAL